MKTFIKLTALLLAALLLSACVRAEMTDVVSFCKHTKTPQSAALSLTDCLLENEGGERRFFWSFVDGLALRLICTEDGRIVQCRVLLQRLQTDGSPFAVTPQRVDAFCALCARACAALEEITEAQTQTVFETLKLRDTTTYAAMGASALFDGGGFFARLVSNDAQTVLELSNRWLAPQSEKQTPESVPAFDETTNIRTETVPLK